MNTTETYNEYKTRKITAKVYDALANISNEEDASEEEMLAALEFFKKKFYDRISSCEE